MHAISVDGAEKNRALAERLDIEVSLLADSGGAAAQAFEVWDADTEIALAATFLIAKGGKLLYQKIGADKTDRPSIDEVLSAAAP